MNSPLRSFLSSIILTIVILFEVLGLLADRHVPFGICQTISSTILSANSFAFTMCRKWLLGASRAPLPLWISSPYNWSPENKFSSTVFLIAVSTEFCIVTSILIEGYLLFRRCILVVEPSPIFRYRSLAADCPLFHPSSF